MNLNNNRKKLPEYKILIYTGARSSFTQGP